MTKLIKRASLAFIAWIFLSGSPAQATDAAATKDALDAVATYGELVYRNYSEAHRTALELQQAVNDFITDPADDSDEQLATVRQAWLDARPSYGESEAFRFYGGPIDFGKREDGTEGPEGRLNAWPLNEAYIDAVAGDPRAGIVNDATAPITRETLLERNAKDDESNVTLGYHAIEFLLWGQDLNADGPGNRSARDFVGDGAPARRREYLKLSTDLLVADLETLVDAWAPGQQNYRARFGAVAAKESIGRMLTGIATLSGFELASERLATALDSGSEEDEQSCFSDNTHIDILANATGIANVYFGRYRDFQDTGINLLVKAVDPALNTRLEQQIDHSVALARALDHPFDQTLASPPGSAQRARVEALVASLQTQAELLKLAGKALGVEVVIASE